MSTARRPLVRTLTWRHAVLAVPHVALGAATALMLVVHPNAVRSALMSTRAVAVSGALAAGWLVLSFVVAPRVLRNPGLRSLALGSVALVGIVALVVPTLHDTRVVEHFPGGLRPEASGGDDAATPTTGGTAPSATAAAPTRVSTAELVGIDHDASGRASIYELPDGRFVVALEDIDVEPGPDYFVHLVEGAGRRSPGDDSQLEKLRGNQGTQYYDAPGGRRPGAGWTVLIWCRAFGVPVAHASQRSA